MHPLRRLAALCVLSIAALVQPLQAQDAPAADVVVRSTAESIMAAVAANRDIYATDPAPLRREVRALLGEQVAFERIARGVMGRHREGATPAQIDRFATVFTSTLIELYAGALVALEAESIEVQPAEQSRPDRARVTMEVTTTAGQKFTLFYSMALGEGGWEVRNMVVNGINLGVTFRNRFDALASEQGGDVDAVIDAWAEAPVTTAEEAG